MLSLKIPFNASAKHISCNNIILISLYRRIIVVFILTYLQEASDINDTSVFISIGGCFYFCIAGCYVYIKIIG